MAKLGKKFQTSKKLTNKRFNGNLQLEMSERGIFLIKTFVSS